MGFNTCAVADAIIIWVVCIVFSGILRGEHLDHVRLAVADCAILSAAGPVVWDYTCGAAVVHGSAGYIVSFTDLLLSPCVLFRVKNAETLEGILHGFCHCVDLVVDTVAKTLDFLAQLRHHLQESVELGGAYHGMTVLDDSTMRRGPDFISSARWETLIPIFGSLILFIFKVDLVFRFTPRISEFASGPIRNVPGTFLLFYGSFTFGALF